MTGTNQTLPADLRLIDDMHLGNPHVIATYLLLGDEPALVDPGPTSTLATLEAGLAAHGLATGDLRALFLTHIHLDHAGAAGTLATRHPQLRVYVHQRGAPHLVNPEKLLRSASRLYGSEMERMWGEVRAVPEQQMTVLAGGETLRLGRRVLRVFDAPGHATHHVVYFEEASGVVFVGDNGGIHLPTMDRPTPATPPPDIDLAAWNRTLDTLLALDPRRLLLTHFGPANDPALHIDYYRACLAHWAEFVRVGMRGDADETTQIARLRLLAEASIDPQATETERHSWRLAAPIDQCWQGLARYWRKREEAA
jgi:glyoxylase-like metal-dependent hydrolase (beta-lactamase superfamily II)